MDQMSRPLRIGEVAAVLKLNPKTLRYYEEIGLIPRPARSTNGYRQYSPQVVEQVRFILKAKAIGFTLEEIREIMTVQRSGEQPCGHVKALLEHKIAVVDAHLQLLADLRQQLVAVHTAPTPEKPMPGCMCGLIETSWMYQTEGVR